MKRFLLIGVVLTAFLSCSKDIILDVNRGAAIEFTVAAHTRAHEVTSKNLMTFYATAVDPRQDVNYFTDLPYMKSGEYYVSSPSYYWPGDASPLNIYAYAPSAADLGVSDSGETTLTIDRTKQVLSNFSPAKEIADQQDFITAVLSEFRNPADGTPVQLEFKHQLVQIEISAKNNSEEDIYHVKGVKIANVKSKGDFDFSTETWNLDDASLTDYVVEYNEAKILDSYVNLMNIAGDNVMETYSDNAMLLPQKITSWDPLDDQQNTANGAYVAVLMKRVSSSDDSVALTDENDGYQWVAVPFPKGTEWIAGNKYIYTLDFSKGASYWDPSVEIQNEISFDVNIVDWEESSESYHPLIGEWEIDNAILALQTYGSAPVVLEMPSQGAITHMDFISSSAFLINFVSPYMFYMYEFPYPGYTEYVDGQLYLITNETEEIKVESYSDEKLQLTTSFEEAVDDPVEGEIIVYAEYEINYTKRGYPRTELKDWEIILNGEWELLDKPDSIDEKYYKLTFPTPYECHFNCDPSNPEIGYTMLLNGKPTLNVIFEYSKFTSLFSIEFISETEFKVNAVIENDDMTTESFELNYKKL